jgi:adenylylsulfate kinase
MSGAIVWFTGLPSSGKSHLARRVQSRLSAQGVPCCQLDGDRVRSLLHPAPGYSASERDAFYLTLGCLAVELAQQGLIVLVPATANRRQYRDQIRGRSQRFLEVWLSVPLEECRKRDAKGLYANFARGELHGMPGEDQAYEAPEFPEVTAHCGEDEEALSRILRLLKSPSVPPRA